MRIQTNRPYRATFLTCALLATGGRLLAQTSVTTQHNDIGRTGQNTTETILTPANVNSTTFGKLYSLPVDGQTYAQPLYMPSVTIGSTAHRVVYAATEHDSVYAFDATTGGLLWKASLLDTAHGAAAGATPDPLSDTGCTDISALNGADEYGITSTPVIDPTTNTLYVVSKTYEGTYPVQRLHALDITNGAEKFGGPVAIAASVNGKGSGSSGGVLTFDPKWENQRAGLLLLNGNVYMAFASHCDDSPWHGWLLGYNAATLAQSAVFVATPNGSASGIWMSGAGLAADNINGAGRLFPVTGNGTYDATIPYTTNIADYGDDILQLTQSGTGALTVTDVFTPDNQAALSNADQDVASGGALVLPDQAGAHAHLLAQLGKSGTMYLVNRDSLGGYSASTNAIVQSVTIAGGLWGMPAYWNGNLYVWPAQGKLNQYSITNGTVSTSPIATSTQSQTSGYGSTPAVSSNGTTNGIVWSLDWSQTPGVLYAHNATNAAQLLWSSAQNSTRDSMGTPVKFVVPTIADGNVFVAANSQLEIYGLLPAATANYTLTAFPAALNLVPGSTTSTQVTVNALNGFSGTPTFTADNLPAGVSASFSSGVLNTYTLTLTAASNAALTALPTAIEVTASSGSIVYSLNVPLNISNTAAAPVNLASTANVVGLVNYLSAVPSGGLDTEGSAYAANFWGRSLYAGGVPFSLGTPGAVDAAANTTIPLPNGSFTTLNLLGAAVNGNQTSQAVVVKYTDGTSSSFTQSFSDWFTPQKYTNETIASTVAYRLTSTGAADNRTFNIYNYAFALNSAKTVQSVVLPASRNVTVLGVTLGGGGTAVSGTTPQTITFGAIAPQTAATTVSLTATSDSGLTVTYSSSTPSVCSVAGATVSLLTAGTCTVTAAQAGNSTYAAAAPVAQSFTVNAAAQTITFNAISAQQVGVPLALTATASSNLTVSYASSTTAVCTVAGATATFVTAGTCTITAAQAGNATYAAAAAVPQTFTVNQGTQTITFGAIAAQKVGTPLTLSATASSGLAVSYASSTTSVCTVTGATATFAAAGTCTITASQAGNASYAAATPVSQSFTVNAAATGSFKLTPSAASVTITPRVCFFIFCLGGNAVTDKISLTAANGFTGAVSFSISGLPSGVTASFSPTSVTTSGTTTLTLTPATSLTGSGKSATLTIKGTAGTTTATTTVTLSY